MTWCPAAGISISGARRPRRSYMSSLVCGDTMPCSALNSATRQSNRVSSAGVSGGPPKTRGSNFQLQPRSRPSTGRIDVAATCAVM